MIVLDKQIGPYQVLGRAGRGGIGDVFLAKDVNNGRRVALKVVPVGDDRESQDVVDAERRGAEFQQQLWRVYPHVPEVFECGTADGYFYIAMEYLDGRNLSDLIAVGPIAPDRAVRIAIQLCRFLEAAHALNPLVDGNPRGALLHGDLKPRNIRILENGASSQSCDGDDVRVFDFGIAKALSLSRKVTRNDFGSLAYLSPERLESGDIDPHSDFWAVGVLLYEMVTGVQPFIGKDTRLLESRIRSLKPPAALDDRVPASLQAVIARLLAARQTDRYASASAIREDLERVIGGRGTVAQYDGWPARAYDEPPTARVRPPVEDEATRRTEVVTPSASQLAPLSGSKNSQLVPTRKPSDRSKFKFRLTVALAILVLALGANEFRASREAGIVEAGVHGQELADVNASWRAYDAIRARSLGIGARRLGNTLVSRTTSLTDAVMAGYLAPVPAVREMQWKAAREALTHAVLTRPDDRRLRSSLRYCDGQLHRIDGEARKSRRQNTEAQREFAAAVTAFREAAELRPGWPDPFLGLLRTFIYGLEDVEKGADALEQARKAGYTTGDREMAQLADGHRVRAETYARTARTLTGRPQELQYLTKAVDEYRLALDLYLGISGANDAARNIRNTERAIASIEERAATMTTSTPGTASALP